ncbi:hypothetical protein PO124_10275 [Bacillus licheniformis]|nr:hypothetical protein [Bacillus licheniformis]
MAEEKKDTVQSTDIQMKLISPRQLVVYLYICNMLWLLYDCNLVAVLSCSRKGFAQGSVGYVAALVAVTAVPGALIFTKYIDKMHICVCV